MQLPAQAVAAFAEPDAAVVQPVAQLLVDVDPAAQLGGVGVAQLPHVEFNAEVPRQCDRGAEGHRLRASRRVRGGGADVGAHDLGREELQETALDVDPRQRVDAVAGPDAVRVAQHAEVDPAAAAGAALDLDVRVGGAQAVHQRVGGVDLRPVAGGAVGESGRGEVAVEVPLQVADRVCGEQRGDLLEQVVAGLGSGDVEHELVARRQQRAAGDLQRPLGVRTEQVAVRVDHLRLDPQAEFHAERVHVRDQRAEAVRELGFVRPPVAQSGAVVVAAVEPAVVEHKTFDADRGRCGREFLDRAGMDIEVEAFPGVQVHRPRLHRATRPVQPAAQFGVEIGGQPVQTGG